MKLFISWSGEVSQQIALELRRWVPLILPAVKPFLTVTDIEKGAKWQGDINVQLEECDYGLVCLTRENLASQWIAFEAGALSKKLSSRVATVLFNLENADLRMPLAMFQSTRFRDGEFRQLVSSINAAAPIESKRTDEDLDTLFPMLWPKIEQPVSLILQSADAARPDQVELQPDYPAMVTELLGLARTQASLWSSPDRLLAPIVDRIERTLYQNHEREMKMREIQDPRQLIRRENIAERVMAMARSQIVAKIPLSDVMQEARQTFRELAGIPCRVTFENDTITIDSPAGRWQMQLLSDGEKFAGAQPSS